MNKKQYHVTGSDALLDIYFDTLTETMAFIARHCQYLFRPGRYVEINGDRFIPSGEIKCK